MSSPFHLQVLNPLTFNYKESEYSYNRLRRIKAQRKDLEESQFSLVVAPTVTPQDIIKYRKTFTTILQKEVHRLVKNLSNGKILLNEYLYSLKVYGHREKVSPAQQLRDAIDFISLHVDGLDLPTPTFKAIIVLLTVSIDTLTMVAWHHHICRHAPYFDALEITPEEASKTQCHIFDDNRVLKKSIRSAPPACVDSPARDKFLTEIAPQLYSIDDTLINQHVRNIITAKPVQEHAASLEKTIARVYRPNKKKAAKSQSATTTTTTTTDGQADSTGDTDDVTSPSAVHPIPSTQPTSGQTTSDELTPVASVQAETVTAVEESDDVIDSDTSDSESDSGADTYVRHKGIIPPPPPPLPAGLIEPMDTNAQAQTTADTLSEGDLANQKQLSNLFGALHPGEVRYGVVQGVDKMGVFVQTFCRNQEVRGLCGLWDVLDRKDGEPKPTLQDVKKKYTVGDRVSFIITSVDRKRNRFFVSFKDRDFKRKKTMLQESKAIVEKFHKAKNYNYQLFTEYGKYSTRHCHINPGTRSDSIESVGTKSTAITNMRADQKSESAMYVQGMSFLKRLYCSDAERKRLEGLERESLVAMFFNDLVEYYKVQKELIAAGGTPHSTQEEQKSRGRVEPPSTSTHTKTASTSKSGQFRGQRASVGSISSSKTSSETKSTAHNSKKRQRSALASYQPGKGEDVPQHKNRRARPSSDNLRE